MFSLGWNVKSFSKSHSSLLRQAGGGGGGCRDTGLRSSSVEFGASALLDSILGEPPLPLGMEFAFDSTGKVLSGPGRAGLLLIASDGVDNRTP